MRNCCFFVEHSSTINDEDTIENVNEAEINTLQDNNSSDINVETDLVSGSKKRNQRSNKSAAKNLVCTPDIDYLNMHGTGEIFLLPCNDISKMEKIKETRNVRPLDSTKLRL